MLMNVTGKVKYQSCSLSCSYPARAANRSIIRVCVPIRYRRSKAAEAEAIVDDRLNG